MQATVLPPSSFWNSKSLLGSYTLRQERMEAPLMECTVNFVSSSSIAEGNYSPWSGGLRKAHYVHWPILCVQTSSSIVEDKPTVGWWAKEGISHGVVG
eukprot:1150328-Pelagomonas_calceolata.AAC.4